MRQSHIIIHSNIVNCVLKINKRLSSPDIIRKRILYLGAAHLNDCNPKEVAVTLGRFNFRVPLRLYAIVACSGSDLRYGRATR